LRAALPELHGYFDSMGRGLTIAALLLVVGATCVAGDYINVMGWGDFVSTTCEDLKTGSYSPLLNMNQTSPLWSTCTSLGSGQNTWSTFSCNSTGSPQLGPWYNDDQCSAIRDTPVASGATWGVPICVKGTNLPPGGFTYIRAVCMQDVVTTPSGTPSSTPVSVPSGTVPQTTPTSTAPSTAPSTTPSTTPASSPTTQTPSTVPSTTPTQTPSPTPSASYTLVTDYVAIKTYSGAGCTNPVSTMNFTSDNSICQAYGSSELIVQCTEDQPPDVGGWPFGFTCDTCFGTCISWSGNNNPTVTFDQPRCIDASAGGFSATCVSKRYYPPPPTAVPVQSPQATPPSTTPSTTPSTSPTSAPTFVPTGPPVTVDWAAQFGTTCNAPAFTGSFSNVTTCQTVYSNSAYAVAYCTPAGTPKGKVCTVASCNSQTSCTSFDGGATTWDQSYCVTTPQNMAISLTCNNHTAPPPPPSTPIPSPPSEPVPPPVSTGGPISFIAYIDNKCRTAATTLDLVADISRCQRASAAGTTIYMRADCYENNTIHGSICGSDSTCSTCQPLPPAPSDLCVPYSVSSIVNGIKITCPPRPEPVAPASKTGAASTISAPPGYACFLVLILNLALLAFV